MASGLLVTRVASTGDRPLGDDLGVQLAGNPRVLGAAAVFLIAVGLVPGLPLAPFLILGALAGGGAIIAARRAPRASTALDEQGATSVRGPRLALALSPALHARLAAKPEDLRAALAAVRAEKSTASGVPVPPMAVAIDPALAEQEAALVLDGSAIAWFTAADLTALRDRLGPALAPIIPELLGVDRVAALVETAGAQAPVLVREVVPRLVSLPVLAETLRALAREELPIDDLPAILEAIALAPVPTGGFTARDVPGLVEQLRGHLRRKISARWAPRGELSVYTVDSMIEDAVRTAVDRRDGVPVLALEPEIAQDIVTAVKSKLGTKPAVILTSGDIRRHLRSLLEPELPAVTILAAHELLPGTAVKTAGRIEVA